MADEYAQTNYSGVGRPGGIAGGISAVQNWLTGGASDESREARQRQVADLRALGITGQNEFNAAGGLADQSRGAQTNALGLLGGAASGQAPSAALAALNQAANQNASAASSLAAGQHGVNPLLALQSAQTAQSQGNSLLGGQAAAARAAEMATARGQYADAAAQQRAEDERRRQMAINAIMGSLGLASNIPGQANAAGDQNLKLIGAGINAASAGATPTGK